MLILEDDPESKQMESGGVHLRSIWGVGVSAVTKQEGSGCVDP